MRKITITTAALAAVTFFGLSSLAAQNSAYTLLFNKSPEDKNYPVMIGLVNIADGNNKGAMMGLMNTAEGWQRGAMTGLYNSVGGLAGGVQMGIINRLGEQQGAQYGIINYVEANTRGANFGIANYTGGFAEGASFGVLNYVQGSQHGAQFGIANMAAGGMQGAQFGVINATPAMSGPQFGILNIAGKYERGVPVGVLNIIGEGGYQAVEVGTGSMFAATLALKTGVRGFYTSIIAGWSPDFNRQVSMGAGVGTMVDMSRKFYFNPELSFISTFEKNSATIYELYPNFGYRLGEKFSLLVAPTFSWQNIERGEPFNKPAYSLWDHRVDDRNELYLGVRVALRYEFGW